MVIALRQPQPQRASVIRILIALLLLTLSFRVVSSWSQYPALLTNRPARRTSSFVALASMTSDNDVLCSKLAQKSFRGKNVLLTGASGGLGHAFALQLAHCGVKTLVLSARSEASLQPVAQEVKDISAGSTQTRIITCDLSDPDSVTKLGQDALNLCDIDVLINNGGVSSRSRFLDTKPEVDQTVMQINFLAGASLAKALVPGMVNRKSGSIIWISSVQGLCKCQRGMVYHSPVDHPCSHTVFPFKLLVGLPLRTSYAASKFAVQGYCEGLRAELATSGVEVHVASPGYIRTNLSKSAITGDGTPHGKLDATTASGAYCVT